MLGNPSHPAFALSAAPELIKFPPLIGSPPVWNDSKLPIHLPREALDKTQPQDHHSKAFSMLMLSAHTTSTESWFDQVDIVTSPSLLGMLLKFSEGSHIRTFRFFLQIIRGSLFLAHDPTLPPPDHTERDTLRSAIRKGCTEMLPGLEHSNHYRGVQYSLGHLNCVVQGRVDALCSTSPGELQRSSSPSPVGSVVGKGYPQSEAAMIQVRRSWHPSKGLPTGILWFTRTPLLLRAVLDREDMINEVTKIDTFAAGRKWEKNEMRQVALRKLATLLSDLKRAVKVAAPDGQACFGLIERERDLEPSIIQVFLGGDKLEVVPEDISNNPWVGKTSHGPDEASNGGGRDSVSEAKPPRDKTTSNSHNQMAQ